MDLKSGSSYWRSSQRLLRTPLRRDLACDVAIIGAGLTGALCAYRLSAEGFDVVLVDKGEAGQGSTSASTALVLYEIDVFLCDLIRRRGKRDAERCYTLCRDAIDEIENLAASLGDGCEFARKQSLCLASSKAHIKLLQSEWKARERMGLNVHYLAGNELRKRFGIEAHAAILSEEAAQINPLHFTQQLVQNAASLRAFGRTEITAIQPYKRGVRLRSAQGHTIVARKAIVAAGYESRTFIPRKLAPLRSTYVIAVKPISGWNDRGILCWETARPYGYLRGTADGRILIGGEDEDFRDPDKRDRLIAAKAKRLESKLRGWFPGITFRLEKAWAGTFGDTKDGLPFIGGRKGIPHVIYALCYGANGTNFAMIAANVIRDELCGRRNADRRLFSLYR